MDTILGIMEDLVEDVKEIVYTVSGYIGELFHIRR